MVKGHRYRDPRDKVSKPHPNPIKKHMRINPHTNKPFKKDDRSPLIPTPDGKDYTKSDHNYWKFFIHYKKEGKSNYHPHLPKRELDSNGFYYEYWKSYIPDTIEPKKRLNPHTNRRFVANDPRPTIPSKDGKVYEQDGMLFASYRYKNVERDDFYREHWATGYSYTCRACSKEFRTVTKNRHNCHECREPPRYASVDEMELWKTKKRLCVAKPEIKQFTGCDGEPKDFSEFRKSKNTSTGVQSLCRACHKMSNRAYKLRTKYDISLEEYFYMVEEQGDLCWICHTPDKGFDNDGRGNRTESTSWKVDHIDVKEGNKTIKVIRGLLCIDCNLALGKFKESEENLKRATEYINNRPIDRFRKNKARSINPNPSQD